MSNTFEIGKSYSVYGEDFKTIKVIARTSKTLTVKAGRDELNLRVKVNPFKEEENVGVEYVDVTEDTTVENWVSANDEI